MFCAFVIFISSIVLQYLCMNKGMNGEFEFLLSKYNSPIVLMYSICMLGFFSKWRIGNKTIQRIIGRLSISAFSVYLLHDNFLIRSYLYVILSDAVDYSAFNLAMVIVVFSVLCYSICVIVDSVRLKLFAVLHVDEIIRRIDEFAGKTVEKYFQ